MTHYRIYMAGGGLLLFQMSRAIRSKVLLRVKRNADKFTIAPRRILILDGAMASG